MENEMWIKEEIRRMCQEKNAIILAHYYTVGDIQDVADFVGDSLALARKAGRRRCSVLTWRQAAHWPTHAVLKT